MQAPQKFPPQRFAPDSPSTYSALMPARKITLKAIMDVIQSMKADMDTMKIELLKDIKSVSLRLDGVEKNLTKRIESVENGLSKRIEKVDQRVTWSHANLTRQIDGIDERLDDIEIETLPRRVRALKAARA